MSSRSDPEMIGMDRNDSSLPEAGTERIDASGEYLHGLSYCTTRLDHSNSPDTGLAVPLTYMDNGPSPESPNGLAYDDRADVAVNVAEEHSDLSL